MNGDRATIMVSKPVKEWLDKRKAVAEEHRGRTVTYSEIIEELRETVEAA